MEFTIDDEKLAQIISLYYEKTGDPATDDDIREWLLADWHEGQEHQDWLDHAPVAEIVNWIQSAAFGDSDTR